MRRPRITSQSANTNSPMPVTAETSDEDPRASARMAESNTYPNPAMASRTPSNLGTYPDR